MHLMMTTIVRLGHLKVLLVGVYQSLVVGGKLLIQLEVTCLSCDFKGKVVQ